MQEFIGDHYKDKADDYVEAIAELSDLRQVRNLIKLEHLKTCLLGSSPFKKKKLPVMISAKC